jgi:hypothetical protein
MASEQQDLTLPSEIRRLLAGLRWRIRGYVWLQGLALAAAWIGATFWCALALDYLPVLAGAGEMPRAARSVLLCIIAGVMGWILYRWVLRRTFVSLADRSMAVLLERRYREFSDGLITSVEMADRRDSSGLNRVLLAATQKEALGRVPHVRTSRVFNLRPLALSVTAAAALLATIGAFHVVNGPALRLGVRRLYLLQDDPWPRQARITVVGVESQSAASTATVGSAALVPFRAGRARVARGSAIRLIVRADAKARRIPDTCTFSYQTADGDGGRVHMTRVGHVRDGYQEYHYDGKPLRDILTNVTFDVVGFDHRVGGQVIEVVDRPAIVDCQLDCVFPRYLVDESLSQWLPRTVPLTSGTQLPQGTRIHLRAAANKELRAVAVVNQADGRALPAQLATSAGAGPTITLDIPPLADNVGLDVTLTDTDGIVSERPYQIYITALSDAPPFVDAVLAGIGTAVTPDVVIPLRGTIRDDYGLQRSWAELAVNAEAPRTSTLAVASGDQLQGAIDFRELRTQQSGTTLKPKDKLSLVVKAQDKYDLGSGPNIGMSDHYELDVVTPDELLAMLEGREIGLRQRFEQIIEETTETRDMLVRVKAEGPASAVPGSEPGEPANAAEGGSTSETSPPAVSKRIWSVRLLRAQQALLQSQKSAQETLGIAAAFRDIREELINNRVDTEDRKQRLQAQLADPLERIAAQLFPELDRHLQTLGDHLDQQLEVLSQQSQDDPQTVARADAAVRQADRILAAMNDVLQNMLNLETYNELLDIVRSLIDEQRRLIDDTKKQQKKQVLELLQ